MIEQLHFHFSLSCIEGNDNPLQCSCLENPRDGGAWWAALYGVAQSWTWLKWLSSSSSMMKVMIDFLSLPYSILSSTWPNWQTPPSWKHFLHLDSRTPYSSCGASYIICGPRAGWKCGLPCSKSKGKRYLKVINNKKAFSFLPLSLPQLIIFFCLSMLFINKEKFRI